MNGHKLSLTLCLLLGYLTSSSSMAGTETALLSSILAPVEVKNEEKTVEGIDQKAIKSMEKETIEKKEMVEIDLEPVLRKLESMVCTQLDEGSNLTLDSNAIWKAVPIEKDQKWDLFLKNNFFPDTNGRWYASFDIVSNGETITSRNLRVDATLYKEVWLTKRRFNKGASPVVPGIEPILRDVFLERGTPVPATANLRDYELVRSIPEGHLLNWADLKVRPSVRRGNLVDVIVHHGAMTVTMRGRSMDDGLKGDNVTIRNLTSNRELVGKVVGIDRVQLNP